MRGGQESEAGRRERRREWRSEAAGRAEDRFMMGGGRGLKAVDLSHIEPRVLNFCLKMFSFTT